MSTLKLNSDGDLAIENNSLVLLTDHVAETAQRLQTKFKFFLGEWSLDTRIGFPLFQKVLVKNPNLGEIRALIRQTVTNDEGVQTMDALELDFDTAQRTLTVTKLEATLNDGEQLTLADFILGENQ